MKVVFVLGPTATGKSDLAIKLAQNLGGVILNADSHQVYAGLKIGSAAPSEEDFLKVTHLLYHELLPPTKASAGWYYRRATEELDKLAKQDQKYVFVVGGTGFYLSVLENGLTPIGGENPKLRLELENEVVQGGGLKLYKQMIELDPFLKEKIAPQDSYRIVRALEIMLTHQKPVTQIQKQWELNRPVFKYPLLKIGVTESKEVLLKRVVLRTHNMIKNGLVEEVKHICNQGFEDWEALLGIGYKETLSYLRGEIYSLDELEKHIIQNTMKLIKKQKTWFNRDLNIKWFLSQSNDLYQEAENYLLTESGING